MSLSVGVGVMVEVCACVRVLVCACVCVCVCMCISIHVHVVQHALFVDAVPQYISWSVVCSDCLTSTDDWPVKITADSHS